MRILIAAHGFPPTHSAGAERRAERMAHWLASHGHEIEVFAVESLNTPGFEVKTSSENGYTVHRLYYDLQQGDQFLRVYDNPQIGQALQQLFSDRHYDLVHLISGYLMGGQLIDTAHAFGIPIVITLTEFWFLCTRLNLIQANGRLCTGPDSDEKCARCLIEDKRRYRLPAQHTPVLMDAFWSAARYLPFATDMMAATTRRRETLQSALNAVDLVICPSQFLIDKFAEYGFETTNFTFMRQGLNAPVTQPPALPATDTLRLVYVGQIQPHKGVDLLIDATIRLLDQGYPVSLDLWGSETQALNYTARLKSRTATYEAIRWNGRYSGAEVWDVLAAADTLVIPSRWYENSPNVILEAFTAGLPVIGTNLGGMAEMIGHERNGLLFELNDPDDLKRQIQRLIDEPDLLPGLRDGIPSVKTIDDEMQEVITHYQRLLGRQVIHERSGTGTAG